MASPGSRQDNLKRQQIRPFPTEPEARRSALDAYERAVKATNSPLLRGLDITITLLILPVALLIGALTAMVIFVDSPGSVFFRSTRVGRDGRTFDMLKFRKMRNTATGIPLTLAEDERFTPIGRLLAMTKLDELPQLWNVLRGDMRLVGPRPEVPQFVAEYADAYEYVLMVRPGITGPAALKFAGESHLLRQQPDPIAYYNETLMPHKIGIDLGYVLNRSVRGDLAVIAATVLLPLRRLSGRAGEAQRAHKLRVLVCAITALTLAVVFATASAAPI